MEKPQQDLEDFPVIVALIGPENLPRLRLGDGSATYLIRK
jgi:hypothetical protein